MNKLTKISETKAGQDGYTTYKNHDEELVAKILAYEPLNTFDYMFNEKWTVEAYEGDEVKCVCDKNVKYFKKADVEKILKDGLKKLIGKENDPLGQFFKQHGKLYSYHPHLEFEKAKPFFVDYDHVWLYDRLDILIKPAGYHNGVYDAMGYITHEEYKTNLSYSGLEIEVSQGWGTSSFVSFNEDGSFLNRNYNVDLNYYTQESVDPMILIERLKTEFIKLGTFLTNPKRTKLYNDNYCMTLTNVLYDKEKGQMEYELTFIPKVEDGVYKKYREKTEKLPAKTTEISGEEAWQLLLDNGMDKIVEKFNNFKKRFANS